MIDRRIANYQNDLIQKQCEQIENIYRTMRGWRHDYHNHVQAMLVLCDQNNLPELKNYLINLNDDLTTVDTSIKTGNVMIDAILNSKMSLIKAHSIPVSAKAAAPHETDLSDIDLCVILGNLLDNAMEACVEQGAAEERFIRIYMGVMKRQLYIYLCKIHSVGERKEPSGWFLQRQNPDTATDLRALMQLLKETADT